MKNVRVVIDNNALLKQLRAILSPLGYEIILSAMDPHLADSDFSETDLIIFDPHLGDIGVTEGLIDTLKSRSATSGIPLLLVAYSDHNDDIVNGLGAGANDFILLPAPIGMLKQRIFSLLQR